MAAAFLAMAVLFAAGVVFYFSAFYFSTTVSAKAGGAEASAQEALASKSPRMSPAKAISLPLFFEPNQGQTAPQVKFLARGAGYGLFLTSDEAVLRLHRPSSAPTATAPRTAAGPLPASSSVIRMKLEGANSAASVSGAEPLPGKSNYFIGNDPAKWRRNIPQFARVEYKSVYPGVDLVYYGDQGQLEYDFRVAPAADPNRIALSFTGAASTRIESGDLILATDQGDVRFHAPRIYQQDGGAQKPIAGSFRQIADNKIGFTIGDYDHSRELVIDPVLSYSTYFGGSGTESLVKVAIDSGGRIYVAGSTDSPDFPPGPVNIGNNVPFQPCLGEPGVAATSCTASTATNIFIAVIYPALQPSQQLVYWTYLGGTQVDKLGGLAVDQNRGIYVAGSTTSSTDHSFPTTTANAFQPGPVSGTGPHGFLSVLALDLDNVYALTYSTYLAGNGVDQVTGLAIDNSGNAYVTGDTTSSDTASSTDGFPATTNGYQISSNSPGNHQFFASKIYTKESGFSSMLYSTYLGGAYPDTGAAIIANGGGIAVDPSGSGSSVVNMYITGETNMGVPPPGSSVAPFPLVNAQQSCLNEAGVHNTCNSYSPTSTTDGFVAKIDPNQVQQQSLVYSTYIGAEANDAGLAIDVDSSGNAYIAGSTSSTGWISVGGAFQPTYAGTGPQSSNGFVAKIGNQSGSVYPINYFTYLGGTGSDKALAIQVDSVNSPQTVHVAGVTYGNLATLNTIQTSPYNGSAYGGLGDAFVALISTTLAGREGAGDYLTYLGGSNFDQGTGITFDSHGTTYVAGTTQSSDFPVTLATAYQQHLDGQPGGPADAFVSQIGAKSVLTVTAPTTSPSPKPVGAGTPATFTFNIGNSGPDTASQVVFTAFVPDSTGLAVAATAKVTVGTGSCGSVEGTTIICTFPTLAVNAVAAVEVDVTPIITTTDPQVVVSGQATANNSGLPPVSLTQYDPIVDFTVTVSPSSTTITDGDTATFQVSFCAKPGSPDYDFPITPSQTPSRSIVTASTPTFVPATVTPGGSCGTTKLSIVTVRRPVPTSSVFRRGSFYAAWLPIAGLSLVSLGIGAGRKRRRWLAGVVLGVIAGAILLQSGCGSSGSSVTTGGGTQAGTYIFTITGSAAAGASHNATATLYVN
jgi:uncharacterized repeat protein (TIGR01451 family)